MGYDCLRITVKRATPPHAAKVAPFEDKFANFKQLCRGLAGPLIAARRFEKAKVEKHWTWPIFISCRKSPSFCEKCQSSWRKLLSYERGEIGRGNWGRPSLVNETGYIIAEK